MVKTPPAMQETPGQIPGLGRSPGERNGNPLQYPCLGKPQTEEFGGLQSVGLLGLQSWTRLSPRTHINNQETSFKYMAWIAGSTANNIPINPMLVVSIKRRLSSLPIKLSWDKWQLHDIEVASLDFLDGPVVKNPPAIKGDMGSLPGLGRFHMP